MTDRTPCVSLATLLTCLFCSVTGNAWRHGFLHLLEGTFLSNVQITGGHRAKLGHCLYPLSVPAKDVSFRLLSMNTVSWELGQGYLGKGSLESIPATSGYCRPKAEPPTPSQVPRHSTPPSEWHMGLSDPTGLKQPTSKSPFATTVLLITLSSTPLHFTHGRVCFIWFQYSKTKYTFYRLKKRVLRKSPNHWPSCLQMYLIGNKMAF